MHKNARSITFVSPVYNDFSTIPRVLPKLEKLAAAHFSRWEILLIDDQSHDGSKQWVTQYASGKSIYDCFIMVDR